jgi:Ca2+-binding protein (EF-Hand superfamily)
MLRALGFRVTQQDVDKEIIQGKRRLGRTHNFDENYTIQIGQEIDLDLVLNIMEESFNNTNYDPSDDLKTNFRLFDRENKGYIQLSDLERVMLEINQEWKQFGMDGLVTESGSGEIVDELNLTDDQLTAMMKEFDRDQDSVINFTEFNKIMDFD